MTYSESITFTDRDEFHRRPVAEKTISLLLSDIEISPMVIDGQWGTGKTEYCHKLVNLLRETDKNVKCAYVDAFKADCSDDPLLTLIAAVANLIDNKQKQSSFIKKAVPAAQYGLKTVGKAGVTWLLKQNADNIAEEFNDAIKSAGEDGVNAAVERLIKEHQEAPKNLETLRNALIGVAKEAPIIIFVDELDRCKPDFAVRMLENIKHVFDVNNVKFVLVCNLSQLENSINHCYGLGVDAKRYLDKFFRFSYNLSDIHYDGEIQAINNSIKHIKSKISEHNVLSKTDLVANSYNDELFSTLVTHNKISLRESEKLIRHIEIFNILCNDNAFSKPTYPGYSLFEILGIFYFCFYPSLCDSIERQEFNGLDLTKPLGIQAHISYIHAYKGDTARLLAELIFLESTHPIPGVAKGMEKEDEGYVNFMEATRFLFPLGRRQGGGSIMAETVRKLRLMV